MRFVRSVVQFNPKWKLAVFPLDESGFPSAVNNTFLSFRVRDKSLTNEVRNEESWLVINPGCSDAACCCGR